MKWLFYAGAVLLALFEAANIYFIMPFPLSQRWLGIDLAYGLYSWRWLARAGAVALMVAGLADAWRTPGWRKLWILPALTLSSAAVYAANVTLAADHMFVEPTSVIMQPADHSAVESARLVVGVEVNGEARAYPVQFIGYHHQVRDTVGGMPVIVTYCTVCRTGRVFSRMLDGRLETFRLVGMDRFNAMFEDSTTRSWWRQATGTAIAGPRKGKALASVPSEQMTLSQWLALHPRSLIMQADPAMQDRYPKTFDYENGRSRSSLTGTEAASWAEKSWVVGITINGESRAYDWNRLRRERIINDTLGRQPIVLVLAEDGASFMAFERPDAAAQFSVSGDRIAAGDRSYDLAGRSNAGALKRVFASQEFWHSWRSFHPDTSTR